VGYYAYDLLSNFVLYLLYLFCFVLLFCVCLVVVLVISRVYFVLMVLKMGFGKNKFGGVGRGVLRFWGPRYRQTRSNFDDFWSFCGKSISRGVDIIYLWWYGIGNQLSKRYIMSGR